MLKGRVRPYDHNYHSIEMIALYIYQKQSRARLQRRRVVGEGLEAEKAAELIETISKDNIRPLEQKYRCINH